MDAITKKAHQCLHFLKRLRRFSMSPTALLNFCRCIVESIPTGSIAAWFSNSDAQEQKRLQKMVQSIMGIGHPTVKGILNIIKDTHHPAQVLFALLLSRRRKFSVTFFWWCRIGKSQLTGWYLQLPATFSV